MPRHCEHDVIAEVDGCDRDGDNLTERDKKVIAYWRSLGWTIPRRELTGEELDDLLRELRKLN